MLKWAKVEDETTGICSVGIGTNELFYQSIGMTQLDVEQAYDGNWYLADKVPVQPEVPLEQLKEEKLNKLKEIADGFEQNVCKQMQIKSSIGYLMDADRRSQQNVQGQLSLMQDLALETVSYRCGDNVIRELTLGQLQTLYKEMLINGQNLYTQKWTLGNAINAAETAEDVEAIEITFTMMDFSAN